MSKPRRPRLSWFRFYADDFLGGTGALTAPECGRYLLLLLHQWGTKERQLLPSEPERLRVICRGEDPGPLVLSKFVAVDGGLRNERLAAEWDAAAKEYNLKAEGGGAKIPHQTPGQIPSHIPEQKGPPTKSQEPGTKNQTEERTVVSFNQSVSGTPKANPLVKGRRVDLERECLSLVTRLAELTNQDPIEVIAFASGYKGAATTKLNPATMSDDRLANTVRDLRRDVKAEELRREKREAIYGKP